MQNKVTLQINLAPVDFRHVEYILPHQLQILSGQVDEILLTVDTQPSKGRFAAGWEEYSDALYKFLEAQASKNEKIKIVPVNYSENMQLEVANYFFGKPVIPKKDFRGGPFYAYFFGLFTAAHDIVFHLDSDIFLGGGSKTWIAEAVAYLQADEQNFTISPLPGPPHPQHILIGQQVNKVHDTYTFELAGMSTRVFMLRKSAFESKKIRLKKPTLRNQLKALIEGNSVADLPEHLISDHMRLHNLKRIDFLGKNKGLWSLHPPYRTATFYEGLPALIRKVEENNLPVSQHGFYDVVDELIDWSEARTKLKNNRWWKRLLK